jgi:hypothetical protein
MKLYPLLFEKEEKSFISYTAPEFALFVFDKTLILAHTDSLLRFLNDKNDSSKVVASMITCSESEKDCLEAMQVSMALGNKEWRGAGLTLYALTSDYFGAPLTSDRYHSSSVAARETWSKIEQSTDWVKVGEGLDNYAATDKGKIYMDIQGTYPKRIAKPRRKQSGGFFGNIISRIKNETEPKTPQEIDDCPLPAKGGSISEPEEMAKIVGTADAYRYKGPLKAAPLIKQAEDIMIKAKDPMNNPENTDVKNLLIDIADSLWNARYKGSDTPR